MGLALGALLSTGCLTYERLAARPYESAPLPRRARVFLIAGGVDVANFAQEVISQRAYWRAQGLSRDEIACYYAKPTRAGFEEDRKQYRSLARELDDCYPARAELLQQHLRAASEARPPFVYVYITTHGRDSLVEPPPEAPPPGPARDELELLHQYFLQMGADPGHGADPGEIVAAYRGGAAPDSLLLTPHSLREALAAFDPEIPKIVVLQGCHSGGFLDAEGGVHGLRSARLGDVPNVTVIAAARHDRTSFGCDPGASMTYFGAVFHVLLFAEDGGKRPNTIPWERVYQELAQDIERVESVKQVTPSLPMFFSNAPASAPTAACDASPPPSRECAP